MVPSSPTISGDTADIVLSEVLEGGSIWVQVYTQGDAVQAIARTNFPTDTANSNRLDWVEEENAFISYEDGNPIMKIKQVEGNNYQFTYTGGLPAGSFVAIYAYVKNGIVNWMSPQDNIRVTFSDLPADVTQDENDNYIYVGEVSQPMQERDICVMNLYHGEKEIDIDTSQLQLQASDWTNPQISYTKQGKAVLIRLAVENFNENAGCEITYNGVIATNLSFAIE